MSDEPYEDRRHLTFEQAEGAEPLPRQLELKELSHEIRALLWDLVYSQLAQASHPVEFGPGRYLSGDWITILRDKHVRHDHKMVDEFENNFGRLSRDIKQIFVHGTYIEVFGWLQFVLRHPKCPYQFADKVNAALKSGRSAYRVLGRTTIVPIASDAEKVTLERAFTDLDASEFSGARAHLRNAASDLTASSCANSIRESIHAVESVARTLAPSGKLSDALAQLEKTAAIHGALKSGFLSIYGYTSDEKGIRHPLLDDEQARVDEADGLFMIGACAAFISYMIHKARMAGILAKRA